MFINNIGALVLKFIAQKEKTTERENENKATQTLVWNIYGYFNSPISDGNWLFRKTILQAEDFVTPSQKAVDLSGL